MKLFQVAVATAAMILFLGVEAKCPLEGKCSYVADKVAAASAAGNEAGDKAGCPLSKAGCPYFDKHAKDATVEAALAADMASKCPMEKCPHYEAMKNGSFDIKAHLTGDASGSATPCPLKDTCPYYKEVKENPEKMEKCPVAGACPHANKKEKAEAGGDYKAAAAKCPHMAAAQAKKAQEEEEAKKAEDVKVDL